MQRTHCMPLISQAALLLPLPRCLTPHAPLGWPAAVAERRLADALQLLRRLDKLLARFVAGADRGDPRQQAGAARALTLLGLRPARARLIGSCLLPRTAAPLAGWPGMSVASLLACGA